jgi:hypothetical protein
LEAAQLGNEVETVDRKDRNGRWKQISTPGFELCRFVALGRGKAPSYLCYHCDLVLKRFNERFVIGKR